MNRISANDAKDFKARLDEVNIFIDSGLFLNPLGDYIPLDEFLASGADPKSEEIYLLRLDGQYSNVAEMKRLFYPFTYNKLERLYQMIHHNANFSNIISQLPGLEDAVDKILLSI